MDMPTTKRTRTRRPQATSNGSTSSLPSSEFVYRTLKEQIISGELPPDSRLIELSIAAQFGVSRTPVREALKRLAAENLVLADPTRGMVVHAPDHAEIEDTFELRMALDGLASQLAAHRITPSEIAHLRLIVETMSEAVRTNRREQLVAANVRFHDVIYIAAGNRMLARVAKDLRDFVRRFTTLPIASSHRVEHVVEEHEAILQALEARDPEAARRASDAHLEAARAYVVRLHIEEETRRQVAEGNRSA